MSDDEITSHTNRSFYWSMVCIIIMGIMHELSIGQAGTYTDWQMMQFAFASVVIFLLSGIGIDIHNLRKEVAQ